MRKLSTHAEWLRLVEISGPFISTTILERAFPQGLESIDTPRRQRLRSAYEEWRNAVDENDPQLTELHREWVRLVLEDILDYDREVLVGREDLGSAYIYRAPECAVTFVPDLAVIAAGYERPRLLISIQSPDVDLEKVQVNDGWPVPLVERMTLLCRTTGVRLGLVTNGERWMLVNAPVGSTSSHISWYSRLWFQETITLKAFLSLFGVRRCFGPAEETLDVLLEESLKHHEEVTDTLGEQVRRAVEVLVQCLDKADQDRNRELLHDVSPAELYEAGLTIMMRLVFVLCAEERGLLLIDDPVYDQYYAISTLRGQLSEDADRLGPEVLDRRHDAWARLLAVFRSIYGGIEHESLRMPALGGSLFDPDRFPFLEGRTKGSKWQDTIAAPLPIDNRTVLLLLEALQLLEQQGGALLLSYKALDVENIGHVYEGLLEHTVARVPEVTIGLAGSQNAKNLNVSLSGLESAQAISEKTLLDLLLERTKRGESSIKRALTKPVDEALFGRVLNVCGGDSEIARRILPFANLLRTDAWNDPIVYRANSFMVTIGADRRETGTHYTPKSLTETVVAVTLEPLAFEGPADGKPRAEWKLKEPSKLLDLKICDPAMGSGAFLVQACRWLAEHLVEAWGEVEKEGKLVSVDGNIVNSLNGDEPMPTILDDRLLIARRLVAEQCLYGVDMNSLAVELAKLSIWLITMAKGRPFGFLDHNLRNGDSLLGVHRIDQLNSLCMETTAGQHQLRIFAQFIETAVKEAIEIRSRLRSTPIRDIGDVVAMTRLNKEARDKLKNVELLADAMVGEELRYAGNVRSLEAALNNLAIYAGDLLNGNERMVGQITRQAISSLTLDLPEGKSPRKPFHWALEFPEVLVRGGFDGIIGNPPFMGGQKISGNLGSAYREFAVETLGKGKRGSADLVAYFFLRAFTILKRTGRLTFIATKTISEGDTREVGLDQILDDGGYIYNVTSAYEWPGKAAVIVAIVSFSKEQPDKYFIDNKEVPIIDSSLSDGSLMIRERCTLLENKGICCIGSYLQGVGFYIDATEGKNILKSNPDYHEVIKPLVRGDDIINVWDSDFPYYGINFGDKTEAEASKFPLAYEIALQKVKPERLNGKDKKLAELWWKYKRPTLGLYRDVNKFKLKRVLVHGFTSKYVAFRFVPSDSIFVAPLVVFLSDSYAFFGLLQSNIHRCWVENVSNMGNTLRYTPSDCFETFPFPIDFGELCNIGQHYYDFRESLMKNRQIGLTDLYNLFHNPDENSEDIQTLRDLDSEIDKAVIKAYGWNDLILNHEFQNGSRGIRYSFCDNARRAVLQRLLILNQQKSEEKPILARPKTSCEQKCLEL